MMHSQLSSCANVSSKFSQWASSSTRTRICATDGTGSISSWWQSPWWPGCPASRATPHWSHCVPSVFCVLCAQLTPCPAWKPWFNLCWAVFQAWWTCSSSWRLSSRSLPFSELISSLAASTTDAEWHLSRQWSLETKMGTNTGRSTMTLNGCAKRMLTVLVC